MKSALTVILLHFAFLSGCGNVGPPSRVKAQAGLQLPDPDAIIARIEAIPGSVQRNEAITAEYHRISELMRSYLGKDSAFPNWYSFGQHASHQGGKHMLDLTHMLEAFSPLSDWEPGKPVPIGAVKKALETMAEAVLKRQNISSFVKLYCANEGLPLDKPGYLLKPGVLLQILKPAKVARNLKNIRISMAKLHDNLASANLVLFRSMLHSAHQFLEEADRSGEVFDGWMEFSADDYLLKQRSFRYRANA